MTRMPEVFDSALVTPDPTAETPDAADEARSSVPSGVGPEAFGAIDAVPAANTHAPAGKLDPVARDKPNFAVTLDLHPLGAGSDSDPVSGLDLRPLGSDSASAPSLGATPLVPVGADEFVRTTTAPTASASCDVLPAVPTSVSRDESRAIRTKLDPIGHWDSVVACPVVVGSQGESSPLINGAIHIFLNPGALMRQLGGPAGAQKHGVKVTRGRLLTLLDEGLKSAPECAGFWLYGLVEQPCFLPVLELEPLAETIEIVLLLARASTGGISIEQAVQELTGRIFFHTDGWGSSAVATAGSIGPVSAAQTTIRNGITADTGAKDLSGGSSAHKDGTSVSESSELLQLFVSPVSLLKSGHVGQVATVGLAEVGEILGGRAGVVVEKGMGCALTIPRELLLESD